jgi:hypothetical protein
MAIGDYRVVVTPIGEPEVTANGDILFPNTNIEVCTAVSPDVWEIIPAGRRSLLLPGSLVILCETQNPGDIPAQRECVRGHIATIVKNYGIAQSDRARRAFLGMLPGGVWPTGGVDIDLELDD